MTLELDGTLASRGEWVIRLPGGRHLWAVDGFQQGLIVGWRMRCIIERSSTECWEHVGQAE